MNKVEIDVDALRVKMVLLKLNYSTLSKKMNCNRNTVADILEGKFYPSYITMGKLKSALNMSQEEAGKIFFVEKLA